MKTRILQTLLFFIFLYSCHNGRQVFPDNTITVFGKTVDSVFGANSHSSLAYIIIPNSGCGGCISSAENLLLEYGKNKIPVKFILTNISSIKGVRNTFGDSIISGSNVYIDRTGLFYSKLPELDQIYPVLVYVNQNGSPAKYDYVNPDNPNAIQHFRQYIDSSLSKIRQN